MSKRLIATIEGPASRMVKVYRDAECDEYIARLYVGGKLYVPADCYDTDKKSILASAESMVKER
jgi:hypothetical protein